MYVEIIENNGFVLVLLQTLYEEPDTLTISCTHLGLGVE